jgi:uncharacterized protein (TIGR02453 family)
MAITCPHCGANFDATLFQFDHRVRCDCGAEVRYPGNNLRAGHTTTHIARPRKTMPITKEPPRSEFRRFLPTIFEFLEELADNNNRPWFQANKVRYESEVLEPCMAFIRIFRPRLKKISPCFVASDRRVGGSLLRVYRDTRFARGGEPYKTNAGIQFRHESARDIHTPGFYVHIAPGECFLAVGSWRPDSESLGQIRQAIIEHPDRWRRARDDKNFRRWFDLAGDSLKRPPRGLPPDHRFAEDLKRTDFLGLRELTEQDVMAEGFLDEVATCFAAARPFMRFLCEALKAPF